MDAIHLPFNKSVIEMAVTCSVVMDLCACIRCGMTASREPCHLQVAPGHGQV